MAMVDLDTTFKQRSVIHFSTNRFLICDFL